MSARLHAAALCQCTAYQQSLTEPESEWNPRSKADSDCEWAGILIRNLKLSNCQLSLSQGPGVRVIGVALALARRMHGLRSRSLRDSTQVALGLGYPSRIQTHAHTHTQNRASLGSLTSGGTLSLRLMLSRSQCFNLVRRQCH